MTKISGVIIMALACITAAVNLQARNIPVPAGTLLQCTIDEPNFSPVTAQVGDPVVCYLRPVVEFGCSAFPPGSQLSGQFESYRKPGRFIGKGWMQIEFTRLILPAGETQVRARVIGLRGFRVDREGKILGHGHPKRDAAGWMIPVLWPVKVVTLPMRGPEPALKGERVLTLRLMDDVVMPCEGLENPMIGSGWHHFGSSSLIEPYSGEPQIQSFEAIEKKARTVFSSWKSQSVSDDARVTTTALRSGDGTGSSFFPPRPAPQISPWAVAGLNGQ